MDSVNLWEISNYNYYNSLNEFLLENDLTNFEVKDFFTPGERVTNSLENKFLNENKRLIYTDLKHPICINQTGTIYINSIYYEENKKRINETTKNTILRSDKQKFTINSNIFDNDFFTKLIESKTGSTIYFNNVDLSNHQIEKLEDSYINAFIIDEIENVKKISSSNVIDLYTMLDIKKNTNFNLDITSISDMQIPNFKHILNGSFLNFVNIDSNSLNKLLDIIRYIDFINKKVVIKINVTKDIKNQFLSSISKLELNNIDIVVSYLKKDYSLKEFIKENNKIANILNNIITFKMTPFEKYVAICNYIKKENYSNLENLFLTLIDEAKIENIEYTLKLDNTYDYFLDDEKIHKYHILNICDKKYNIDGYFVSSLIDNEFNLSKINNKGILQDKVISLFTSFDFNDFCDKINFILNQRLKNNLSCEKNYIFKYYDALDKEKKVYEVSLINTYKSLFNDLMEILKKFDYKIYEQYHSSIFNSEQDYTKFLTEIGNYIVLKNGNIIFEDSILKANLAISESKDDSNLYSDNINDLYNNLLKVSSF